jgi:hypothetical protein
VVVLDILQLLRQLLTHPLLVIRVLHCQHHLLLLPLALRQCFALLLHLHLQELDLLDEDCVLLLPVLVVSR